MNQSFSKSSSTRIPLRHILAALLLLSSLLCAQFQIEINKIGGYTTGVFAQGAAEILAHDPDTQRLFVINGAQSSIDVLDISNPHAPALLFSIDLTPYGHQANSVAVSEGLVVAAVESDPKQDPGKVVFFDTDGNYLRDFPAGALPDMITFSDDGNYVLVANEGEPSDDYSVDPEGSVTIVYLHRGLNHAFAKQVDFRAFNNATLDPSIRIFGPNATVAQDLEPEYIAIVGDEAFVTLQENNAIAVVDIRRGVVKKLIGLGFKDHSLYRNSLDASNEDGGINIANWPVWGMYQPDAIASFRTFFQHFLITANEGDSRDYGGFSEEERMGDLPLDPTAFPDAATLQLDENLGRLKSTITMGDDDNDGDYDRLFSYGARSFAIWNTRGQKVYDSGNELERITAMLESDNFNSDDEENGSFDDRSDDKGPEPEGIAIGRILWRTFAFIGLERVGGIVVYDVTNPYHPEFLQYINTRDFSGDPVAGTAGDLSPEGLQFIPHWQSPTRKPLLAVAYEVSGSTALFEVNLTLGDQPIADIDAYARAQEADESGPEPQSFSLEQNHPNPFNPTTDISFYLPEPGQVTLKIYNPLGQEVRTLVSGIQETGAHTVRWDSRDNAGNPVSSGVYFYKLQAADNVVIKKMNLLR
ncbi:MAG: choice-of-anchor I family protein [Calditrichaeota bacterium]|nr:choice-of-anchor I family protein [Calditrichota bacterium]HQU74074.1 choice-of-anchor I family protein [Calditrichia bacterium]